MKKVELLAPAGDKESLIAAIQNGADAIYLGGSLFNARAFAKNFDNEDLKWAIKYAHLREVKIYVTVNTLYTDAEFEELINYIDFLYDIQIDALIIQDLGLFNIVRNRYKDFEIHMSTQASVMNKYSAKYFEEHNAQRVVLARENTIDEIKEIADYTNIELEVFVHGALCMGYSGQCLMSSMIGKRSGNRGQCAQPCRLEYQLKKDDTLLQNNSNFLLSPKDLNTIDHIGELIDAGVKSFKIEGRMKRPEYVAAVVNAYRKAIDAHLKKQYVDLTNEKNQMKQMFNRDYTTGYLFKDKMVADGLFSGNRGVIIGDVISYSKNKKRAVIKLKKSLKQGDSILFESIDKGRPVNKMYINNKLVSHADINDIVEIEFDFKVNHGHVRKIIDIDLIKELESTYNKDYKKVPVDFIFIGKRNMNPQIILKYKDIIVNSTSDVTCEIAIKTPLDKDRIAKQLNKLGDTPFKINTCTIDMDSNIIIPIKAINELRRNAIDKLIQEIENVKIHKQEKKDITLENINYNSTKKEMDIFVSDLNQLKAVIKYPIRYVYYPYSKEAGEAYKICHDNNTQFVLFIPRIVKSKELDEILNSQIYKTVNKIVVNEIGALEIFKDKEIIIGSGLNVFNSYSCQYLDKETILSLEMDVHQINSLSSNNKIVQVYGKFENMISEFCPISQFYFNKQVKKCNKCKEANYSLIDRKKEQFDLLMDDNCRMHLLHNKPLYFDKLNKIKSNIYLLHFTNEDVDLIENVMNDYFNYILNDKKSIFKDEINYTNSYLQ